MDESRYMVETVFGDGTSTMEPYHSPMDTDLLIEHFYIIAKQLIKEGKVERVTLFQLEEIVTIEDEEEEEEQYNLLGK